MFGKSFAIEIEHNIQDLMHLLSDNLKENGISHFNAIEGNNLKGLGDAGMGVFEIDRKRDRDGTLKLFVSANSQISADILRGIILVTFDYIEENKLYEVEETLPEEEEEVMDYDKETECIHDFLFLKSVEVFGIEVNVFGCSKCNKLEFYKS